MEKKHRISSKELRRYLASPIEAHDEHVPEFWNFEPPFDAPDLPNVLELSMRTWITACRLAPPERGYVSLCIRIREEGKIERTPSSAELNSTMVATSIASIWCTMLAKMVSLRVPNFSCVDSAHAGLSSDNQSEIPSASRAPLC